MLIYHMCECQMEKIGLSESRKLPYTKHFDTHGDIQDQFTWTAFSMSLLFKY